MSRKSQRGLTLVELLIAMALLGFVLLGITPLFIASVKSNYAGNEYSSINMLARDRLEQLMNLPFNDVQIAPGIHPNDLPPVLPDPATGLPPASGGVRNPFTVCYQVFQYQIPTVVAANASFTPIPVVLAGNRYDYRRIEVTVRSSTGPLGLGTRMSRVSGVLSNPFPQTNLSLVDLGGACP
jgi:prepilin-type N-terminal cleavage/methylation domain-containing protein